MPFRKRAKGLKVRGKSPARSNKVPVVGAGHDAAPIDSKSRRTRPVKRSESDSKLPSGQRDLKGAASKRRRLQSSASAQSSVHGSSPRASHDTISSPTRRAARQAAHKAELAADFPGRKTAGGQFRKGRPLSKVTGNSKVDDSQQATSTPAMARSRRTSRPISEAGGSSSLRSAEKLEGHADASVTSGAAGSSRSKLEVSSSRGPDLVVKQLPKSTSALTAAKQSISVPSGVSSVPATNRSGRGGPAKRAVNTPEVREQAGPVAPRQNRAARTTVRPKPSAPPTRGSGRTVTGTNEALNTRKNLAKGEIAKNTTTQTKTAASSGCAKRKQVGKKRRGASLDAEEVSSDATDSSYVVPRGLLQPYRRKDRFFDDYVKPWQEEESFSSDSEFEDISNASISSIIPPAGMLQPYRKKRRLIATSSEDSLSELDDDDDDEQDLSSRCYRMFGMDTLPNSTTTKAEAISMLVSFVSSRRLPWGALAELVTLVNKLFAPVENVLPDPKTLANILSLMP